MGITISDLREKRKERIQKEDVSKILEKLVVASENGFPGIELRDNEVTYHQIEKLYLAGLKITKNGDFYWIFFDESFSKQAWI
jgi:hypothetical protein